MDHGKIDWNRVLKVSAADTFLHLKKRDKMFFRQSHSKKFTKHLFDEDFKCL